MLLNAFSSSSSREARLGTLVSAHFKAGGRELGPEGKRGFVRVIRRGRILPSRITWSRKYLCLDSSRLYYLQASDDGCSLELQSLCDIMFASIKEQRNISCSFTISGATRDGLLSTTTIQCSGRQELEEWVAAIRRATEATLAGPRPNPNNSDPRFASPTDLDRIRTARQQREEMSVVIEAIAALSRNCAECGAAAPDWTLLNHGALICIQCSGVHRSLGSKIRSLRLDDLEPLEYQMLLQTGNAVHNTIWEADINGTTFSKPCASDCSDRRRLFIEAKYADKQFMGTGLRAMYSSGGACGSGGGYSYSSYEDMLMSACRSNDIHTAALAIAHGADVNYSAAEAGAAEDAAALTCLEIAAKRDHRSICVMLLLNGCTLVDRGATLLANLSEGKRHELVEYIAARVRLGQG